MIELNNAKEEKNKITLKEMLKKNETTRDILTNLIYSAIIIVYFIFFNLQYKSLAVSSLSEYIKISSLVFLGIAIIMLEIGYRKKLKSLLINGIEFSTLAAFILLMQHLPKLFKWTDNTYILIGSYLFAVYYILKSAILYTKEKQNELNSLSDIKEIVKEEPRKKPTKRKNIKIEEGK